MGLQVTQFTLTKVLQLYETKNSRHSTMIVGGTGSSKTTSWKILQASLTSLCRAGDPNFNIVRVRSGHWHGWQVLGGTGRTPSRSLRDRIGIRGRGSGSLGCQNLRSPFWCRFQEFPLNPKALSLGELYGEYDLSTNEWTDGILSSVMRAACAGTQWVGWASGDVSSSRESGEPGHREHQQR